MYTTAGNIVKGTVIAYDGEPHIVAEIQSDRGYLIAWSEEGKRMYLGAPWDYVNLAA